MQASRNVQPARNAIAPKTSFFKSVAATVLLASFSALIPLKKADAAPSPLYARSELFASSIITGKLNAWHPTHSIDELGASLRLFAIKIGNAKITPVLAASKGVYRQPGGGDWMFKFEDYWPFTRLGAAVIDSTEHFGLEIGARSFSGTRPPREGFEPARVKDWDAAASLTIFFGESKTARSISFEADGFNLRGENGRSRAMASASLSFSSDWNLTAFAETAPGNMGGTVGKKFSDDDISLAFSIGYENCTGLPCGSFGFAYRFVSVRSDYRSEDGARAFKAFVGVDLPKLVGWGD